MVPSLLKPIGSWRRKRIRDAPCRVPRDTRRHSDAPEGVRPIAAARASGREDKVW